ncbi:pentatricopeptide repeat-containing protein At4g20770 isoform X2 [Tripterygium wilfordii]|nr:pentatricopeptide repeat-containing protein At4g20770 isoform X2 [Tripterygium wilfordii]
MRAFADSKSSYSTSNQHTQVKPITEVTVQSLQLEPLSNELVGYFDERQLANLLQSCIDRKTRLVGKILHAYILRNGFFTDTFLCNRLIEFYSKCNNTESAHHVFDRMPQKNIYSWNAILCAFCKAGNLDYAYELFDRMPERNAVSCNNLISALVHGGFKGKALDAYDTMISEGLIPTHFTLASVLSACGVALDVGRGRRCHGISIKIGIDMNLYVGNALLSMYAKCGLMRDAIQVFEGMGDPNEVTFTAMMAGLAHTDKVVEALEMFRLMCRKGIPLDSVSFSSILGVCARGLCGESDVYHGSEGVLCYVLGQQVHGLTIRTGFESDPHLGNSLLDMYAKRGDMDNAELIFNNLPQVSVVSWNIMIAGYGQKYQGEKALQCMHRMQYCGVEPDEVTYINTLAACIRSGDIGSGRELFDSMSCQNVSSWNTMLSGYFQNGNHKEAINLFRQMQFRKMQPDRTTLAIILSSCAALGLQEAGKQVHAASVKAAFHTDVYVASGLISMYSKCGKTGNSERIFYSLPEIDIVCWNSIISGFSANSQDKEAFILFKQMQQKGISPSQFSYSTVLSCCSKLSSSFQGRQVHAMVIKDGFMAEVFVGTSLIDMYCKCGDVDAARRFLEMMPCKNIVTWNEMIHGFAQNGRGEDAVCLYKEMIGSGVKPDDITFVAVLTACSHSGMVDAAVEIFNSMHQEYEMEPALEHYTCVIDCLSRAGRFHEAEVLIDKMPYKDDPVLWEVLLSSCRVHANVGLAERAAEELFRLDPQSSVPYVLLANLYTSSGRWDDARVVRELMSDRNVVKDPGYSWVEYQTGIQSVSMDDKINMVDDDVDERCWGS